MTVGVNLTMGGTELQRGDGRAPLMAYSAMADGHVVHAGVFDPEQQSVPNYDVIAIDGSGAAAFVGQARAEEVRRAVHSND